MHSSQRLTLATTFPFLLMVTSISAMNGSGLPGYSHHSHSGFGRFAALLMGLHLPGRLPIRQQHFLVLNDSLFPVVIQATGKIHAVEFRQRPGDVVAVAFIVNT